MLLKIINYISWALEEQPLSNKIFLWVYVEQIQYVHTLHIPGAHKHSSRADGVCVIANASALAPVHVARL